jgi:hypothetical protein
MNKNNMEQHKDINILCRLCTCWKLNMTCAWWRKGQMSLSTAYVSTAQNMSYVLIPWALHFLFRTNIAEVCGSLIYFYMFLLWISTIWIFNSNALTVNLAQRHILPSCVFDQSFIPESLGLQWHATTQPGILWVSMENYREANIRC